MPSQVGASTYNNSGINNCEEEIIRSEYILPNDFEQPGKVHGCGLHSPSCAALSINSSISILLFFWVFYSYCLRAVITLFTASFFIILLKEIIKKILIAVKLLFFFFF
jgi:hypothetical protein